MSSCPEDSLMDMSSVINNFKVNKNYSFIFTIHFLLNYYKGHIVSEVLMAIKNSECPTDVDLSPDH